MPEFPDISEHQGRLGDEWFRQWPGVIIRVHSGYRYDLLWEAHLSDAQYAGIPVGFYGYVVGDRDGGWQADQMYEPTRDIPAQLGWWTDAEDAGVTSEIIKAHVERLREVVPGQHGTYSNVGDYHRLLAGHADDLPWWVAGYGPNDGQQHPLHPAAPRDYLIHQFTSRGGPGGSGLDVNSAATLDFFDTEVAYPSLPSELLEGAFTVPTLLVLPGQSGDYFDGPAHLFFGGGDVRLTTALNDSRIIKWNCSAAEIIQCRKNAQNVVTP